MAFWRRKAPPEDDARLALYVHLANDGGIFVVWGATGEQAWIGEPELVSEVEKLRESGGRLIYSRDDAAGDPPDTVMRTFQRIVDLRVPIQLLDEAHPQALLPPAERRSLRARPMRIDHVIYATADLDAAAERIEAELGVASVAGGRHERIGTHNRIVPLDGGYLELLAVADAEEASRSALGQALQRRIASVGDGLMGWAVAVDDVAPVAARLGLEVSSIAREGMSAHLTGVAESMREPFLPFFIARDAGVRGPSARPDRHGIAWVEVAGDAERLRGWLGGGGAQMPVRVVHGRPGVTAVGIGDRELRTA